MKLSRLVGLRNEGNLHPSRLAPCSDPTRVSKLPYPRLRQTRFQGREWRYGHAPRENGRAPREADYPPGISRSLQHHVIGLPGSVRDGGQNIFMFQERVVAQHFLERCSGAEERKQIRHAHSLSADTRPAATFVGLDRDSLKQFAFCRDGHQCSRYRNYSDHCRQVISPAECTSTSTRNEIDGADAVRRHRVAQTARILQRYLSSIDGSGA
jgi:hypothetical protein